MSLNSIGIIISSIISTMNVGGMKIIRYTIVPKITMQTISDIFVHMGFLNGFPTLKEITTAMY